MGGGIGVAGGSGSGCVGEALGVCCFEASIDQLTSDTRMKYDNEYLMMDTCANALVLLRVHSGFGNESSPVTNHLQYQFFLFRSSGTSVTVVPFRTLPNSSDASLVATPAATHRTPHALEVTCLCSSLNSPRHYTPPHISSSRTGTRSPAIQFLHSKVPKHNQVGVFYPHSLRNRALKNCLGYNAGRFESSTLSSAYFLQTCGDRNMV